NKLYEHDNLLQKHPETEDKNNEVLNNTGVIEYFLGENLEDDMVAQIKIVEFFNEIEISQYSQKEFESSHYEINGVCQSKYVNILQKTWFIYKVMIHDSQEKNTELNGSGILRELMPPIPFFSLDNQKKEIDATPNCKGEQPFTPTNVLHSAPPLIPVTSPQTLGDVVAHLLLTSKLAKNQAPSVRLPNSKSLTSNPLSPQDAQSAKPMHHF
ncbi:MAG: hypothetical protein PUP91_20825, partial [Rhizonema sp. PD37]|nr:hypothetical protein [Rhizonema sp. PD37]